MRFIDLDEAIATIRSVLGDSVITEMVCDKLNGLAADDDALLPQYGPDVFEDHEAPASPGQLRRINPDGGDYDERIQ